VYRIAFRFARLSVKFDNSGPPRLDFLGFPVENGPKTPQNREKSVENGPKTPEIASKMAQNGPKMAVLGGFGVPDRMTAAELAVILRKNGIFIDENGETAQNPLKTGAVRENKGFFIENSPILAKNGIKMVENGPETAENAPKNTDNDGKNAEMGEKIAEMGGKIAENDGNSVEIGEIGTEMPEIQVWNAEKSAEK
jgi:hypothetical protein